MAVLENLQRKDLDCFEEAMFLRRLCSEFHMTQQEAAARVGKTQSAVANKIRLLKLGPEVTELVRNYQLTERHARTLLQLEEDSLRLEAANHMGQRKMTVAQAEAYVERLLAEKPRPRRQGLIRDARLFCNTVDRAVRLMQESGLQARMEKRQEGEDLILTVRVTGAVQLQST
jgi:ParB family chromosome partitioning protein